MEVVVLLKKVYLDHHVVVLTVPRKQYSSYRRFYHALSLLASFHTFDHISLQQCRQKKVSHMRDTDKVENAEDLFY